MRKLIAVSLLLMLISTSSFAQKKPTPLFPDSLVSPRMRVIIDNDFGGDPDGLFELVHHLLSPSVEIRAIIGSLLRPGDGFDPSQKTATHAKEKIEEVLRIMNLTNAYPVYEGSNFQLENDSTAQNSEAAKVIIKEAMRTDTKLPLYIVCGAGLTDIASAFLMEPSIANRITLVWIGGPEYPDVAPPPPGYTPLEYNLGIDINAARVIFNKSKINIWQVPRNSYRQVILPYSTLLTKIKPEGRIGAYLAANIERVMKMAIKYHFNVGEVYITGDSPLVLLTALQSSFEADPSSSSYQLRPAPLINAQGLYEINNSGRNIRVYNRLDTRLLLNDLYSKLELFNHK